MRRQNSTAVTILSFSNMLGRQEREAHAATDAQFRSLYRDKYAPLKAWLAGTEGEVRGPPLPAGAQEIAGVSVGSPSVVGGQTRAPGADG